MNFIKIALANGKTATICSDKIEALIKGLGDLNTQVIMNSGIGFQAKDSPQEIIDKINGSCICQKHTKK